MSLRASVLDRARNVTEPDLEVVGEERRIGELADTLGVKILRAVGRDRPIGSKRHVSIGSRTLPALKEFLRGEQFYRRGLWDSALVHYDRAIAQDSTFGLPLFRMSRVLGWGPATSAAYGDLEAYERRAVTLMQGLSPRDSLLFAADSLTIAAADARDPAALVEMSFRAGKAFEEAARRYPDDPEIWYELGEFRTHWSPPLGHVPGPALEAFDRAIAIDSGFTPAYEHAVDLAMQLGRPEWAKRYARAYIALGPTDAYAPALRLVALVFDSGIGSPAVARAIRSASANTLMRVGNDHLEWWADSAETAVMVMRELATGRHDVTGAPSWVADSVMWPQRLASALAFRGHLHAAAETDRWLLADPAGSRFSANEDPFLDLALLGIVPDSTARRQFSQGWGQGADWAVWPLFPPPRYLRGLPWWLSRSDTASLARFVRHAAEITRKSESHRAVLRGRYFSAAAAAYLSLARGDSSQALRQFQAIPDALCMAGGCFFEKLTVARLLVARGEDRRAADLLDRWLWVEGNTPSAVLAALERGRIAERLGDREKALERYGFVANVWRNADPELRPYVEDARAGLRRLTKEPS